MCVCVCACSQNGGGWSASQNTETQVREKDGKPSFLADLSRNPPAYCDGWEHLVDSGGHQGPDRVAPHRPGPPGLCPAAPGSPPERQRGPAPLAAAGDPGWSTGYQGGPWGKPVVNEGQNPVAAPRLRLLHPQAPLIHGSVLP